EYDNQTGLPTPRVHRNLLRRRNIYAGKCGERLIFDDRGGYSAYQFLLWRAAAFVSSEEVAWLCRGVSQILQYKRKGCRTK
ncbi:MAG: hypothetical protein ACLSXO_04470, partial [Coprococcus sp.]